MKAIKEKMEFSKKILIVAAIINIAVIVFTCLMIWTTRDLSPLPYLIPSVATEVATGTGFYYWKARFENSIKLKQKYRLSEEEVEKATEVADEAPY